MTAVTWFQISHCFQILQSRGPQEGGNVPYVDLSTTLPVWEKSAVAVPNSPSNVYS